MIRKKNSKSRSNFVQFLRKLSNKEYLILTQDIILDLKLLLGQNYFALFESESEALNVFFSNGQKFKIIIQEI